MPSAIALTLAAIAAVVPGPLPAVRLGAVGTVLAAAPVETVDAAALGPVDPQARLEAVRRRLEEAERLDARKFLPASYRVTRAAIAHARDLADRLAGATSDSVPSLQREAAAAAEEADRQTRRLLGYSRLVSEAQRNPQPWETVAERLDQVLAEIARAGQISLTSGATLPESAPEVSGALGRRLTRGRVLADSLGLVARRATQHLAAEDAARESTLTSLRAELAGVRRQLWESELKTGLLQADRDASQRDLEQQRQRAQALGSLEHLFAPGEGEIHLTPDGVILDLQGLEFPSGSTELAAGGDELLDKVGEVLAFYPDRPLRVAGHTDATGPRGANLKLSRDRAERVARLLMEKFQIPAERLSIIGYGPDRPIAGNDTPEGRARNRRIEVMILPAK